jgi:heterodisulfide reductase subunit C
MEIFLSLTQQMLFVVLLGITVTLVYLRGKRIADNIKLGKDLDRSDRADERWRTMLLIAFGQKKMFDRPIVGFLHLAVYAGFLLINIEMLEIVIDGLSGGHRVFAPLLGGMYNVMISFFELLGLAVTMACIVFLLRRNVLLLSRFQSAEMKAWPRQDANTILISEILLMTAIFCMNGADAVLQSRSDASEYIQAHYPPIGSFLVSGSLFVPFLKLFSTNTLFWIERFGWWFHIAGIFAFTVYVTYSKHLHIALAFPNTYFSNLRPKGEFTNNAIVTREVQLAMGLIEDNGQASEIGRFGAKDVQDLTWKNLLEAYSCTECGRCTSVCPANLTGKTLSPRKIMMDTRDRIEEVGENIVRFGKHHDDGKSLYGDYISKEELMACTSCNACAEACPINIDPLNIIVEIRRYIAMEESSTPASWNSMFANIENNFAPWAFSPSDRFNWAAELLEKENKS